MRGRSVVLLVGVGVLALSSVVEVAPVWDSSRMHPNDRAAAYRAFLLINTAQVQYYSNSGRYARSLAELGPSGSNLLPSDLAARGYRFTMTPTLQGYRAQAVPIYLGAVARWFYTDQSLIVRENVGREPATAASRVVGAAAKR